MDLLVSLLKRLLKSPPLSRKFPANDKNMEKLPPSPLLAEYAPGKGYIAGILAFKE